MPCVKGVITGSESVRASPRWGAHERRTMRRILVAILILPLVSSCGVLSLPTPNGPFSRLIVFGDSFSDTGNVFAITQQLVPYSPYVNGRFSNGDLWVDVFARRFGLSSRSSMLGGTNFACGASGSESGLAQWDAFAVGPNLHEQINLFRGRPTGTDLVVVWTGSIDVLFHIRGGCTTSAEHIAENIAGGVRRLYDRGARHFLVPNIPDLGSMPEYRDIPEGPVATTLCNAASMALSSRLDELDQLPDIYIYRLDVAAILAETIANPPAGITNVNEPAWTGGFLGTQQAGELRPNPDQYLFFDEVHPSRVWHGIIADAAIALIEKQTADLPQQTAAPLDSGASALPALDYWSTWLSIVLQGSPSDTACRY